jgi:SAM domain (Sterile alpha motif)/SH3 domain/PH domain
MTSVLCRVQGLYDYSGQDDTELSFSAGDIIQVVDQSDNDWWFGVPVSVDLTATALVSSSASSVSSTLEYHGGYFPSSYVSSELDMNADVSHIDETPDEAKAMRSIEYYELGEKAQSLWEGDNEYYDCTIEAYDETTGTYTITFTQFGDCVQVYDDSLRKIDYDHRPDPAYTPAPKQQRASIAYGHYAPPVSPAYSSSPSASASASASVSASASAAYSASPSASAAYSASPSASAAYTASPSASAAYTASSPSTATATYPTPTPTPTPIRRDGPPSDEDKKNMTALLELQSQFCGDVAFAEYGRSIISKGMLTKLNASFLRRNKQYYFFLFTDILLYATYENGKFKIRKEFQIDATTVLQDQYDVVDEIPHRFLITFGDKDILVAARNADEKVGWMADIRAVIKHRQEELAAQLTSMPAIVSSPPVLAPAVSMPIPMPAPTPAPAPAPAPAPVPIRAQPVRQASAPIPVIQSTTVRPRPAATATASPVRTTPLPAPLPASNAAGQMSKYALAMKTRLAARAAQSSSSPVSSPIPSASASASVSISAASTASVASAAASSPIPSVSASPPQPPVNNDLAVLEKPTREWNVADVCSWLRIVDFELYVSKFDENKVDGDLLLELEEDDLVTELGITKSLHRKRMIKKIDKLKAEESKMSTSTTGAHDADDAEDAEGPNPNQPSYAQNTTSVSVSPAGGVRMPGHGAVNARGASHAVAASSSSPQSRAQQPAGEPDVIAFPESNSRARGSSRDMYDPLHTQSHLFKKGGLRLAKPQFVPKVHVPGQAHPADSRHRQRAQRNSMSFMMSARGRGRGGAGAGAGRGGVGRGGALPVSSIAESGPPAAKPIPKVFLKARQAAIAAGHGAPPAIPSRRTTHYQQAASRPAPAVPRRNHAGVGSGASGDAKHADSEGPSDRECSKCHTPAANSHSKFCAQCGSAIISKPKPAGGCTQCGMAKLNPNSKFCAGCGNKF